MKTIALMVPLLLASALLPPVAPAQAPLCADECRIEQNAFVYLPPIAVVPDGARVVFASLDVAHVTSPGTGVGGATGCFWVRSASASDAPPVQFDIADDALFATTLDGGPGGAVECLDAVALGLGAFALPYYCVLHPSMRGALVVTASPL